MKARSSVPPSFVALFVEPGRVKPNASRQHILARYELCEDLATMLMDHAKSKQRELGIAEGDVLERIHRGLLSDGAGVEVVEAAWVTRRLEAATRQRLLRCYSTRVSLSSKLRSSLMAWTLRRVQFPCSPLGMPLESSVAQRMTRLATGPPSGSGHAAAYRSQAIVRTRLPRKG